MEALLRIYDCGLFGEGCLLEFELFDAGQKRLVAHAEPFGGSRLVVVAFLQSCGYLSSLYEPLCSSADFRQRASQIEAVEQRGLFSSRVVRRRADVQILRGDLCSASENARSLNAVFQFAHVARP